MISGLAVTIIILAGLYLARRPLWHLAKKVIEFFVSLAVIGMGIALLVGIIFHPWLLIIPASGLGLYATCHILARTNWVKRVNEHTESEWEGRRQEILFKATHPRKAPEPKLLSVDDVLNGPTSSWGQG